MRVLLVDSEADLLPVLQPTLLAVPGLELYCAPDGPTAVQHAQLLGGVDVLLSDVFVPGLDGLALRDALQGIKPGMRTIFLTKHDLGTYSNALKNTPVLALPVNPEMVLAEINRPQASLESTPSPKAPSQTRRTPSVASAVTSLNRAISVEPSSPGLPVSPQNAGTPKAGAPVRPSVTPSVSEPSGHMRVRQTALPAAPQPSPEPVALIAARPAPPTADDSYPPASSSPLAEGSDLGPYRIVRIHGSSSKGRHFTASHSTLKRSVELVVMDPHEAAIEDMRADFLAEAGAKAAVQHPAFLTVYEAGEIGGHIFYSLEHLEANSLETVSRLVAPLDYRHLLQIVRTTASGILNLQQSGTPRSAFELSHVLLPEDNVPRLQNTALTGLHPAPDEANEIATLGFCLLGLTPPDAPPALRSLLGRTAPNHQNRIRSWQDFFVSGELCQTTLDLHDDGLQKGRKQHGASTRRWPRVLLSFAAILGIAAAIFQFLKPESLTPEQVTIPSGQYLVGNGRKVTLSSFSLDKTEVSNRQYARYLDWLRAHPNEAANFDHPEQPAHHSHVPTSWKDLFPESAKPKPRTSEQNPLWDLPVTQLTWWDAFAFAHWAGRDLPTEEEWEAAARGPRGLLFPWGDEPAPERTNVKRLDSTLKPGEQNTAAVVDSLHDASPFGAIGLSGNVSEWTGTRRDKATGVAKGGHFNAPLLTLDAASSLPLGTRSPSLGFRTATRSPKSR